MEQPCEMGMRAVVLSEGLSPLSLEDGTAGILEEELTVLMPDEKVEVFTSSVLSVLPLPDSSNEGGLVYPVTLDGWQTSALLDHGATVSFIEEKVARSHGLGITQLAQPRWLMEFTGKRTKLTTCARVQKVGFAGLNLPWCFLITETAPKPVVIGLDLIRRWRVVYDPRDDAVFCLRNQGVVEALAFSEDGEDARLNQRFMEAGSHSKGIAVDWVLSYHSSRKANRSSYCLDLDQCALALSTVTASTEVDEARRSELLCSLPALLKDLPSLFPQVFGPP